MADSYLERVAGELADLALADEAATGEEKVIDVVGEMLGSTSQTLQEAYLTAVRVRRAEKRAREYLGKRQVTPTGPKARLLRDRRNEPEVEEDAIILGGSSGPPKPYANLKSDKKTPKGADEEEDAFGDALSSLDAFIEGNGKDEA